MVAIRESLVQYSSGALNMHGFLAKPSISPAPAVIVIHEWWGLNDHIRDIAKRLAAAGYVALAPDLYSRLGHPVATDPQEAATLMQSLREPAALKDLEASLAYVSALPEVDKTRMAVLGFCMGGAFALQLACSATAVRAAVAFYATTIPDDEMLRHLRCQVLFVYGGKDEWVKRAEVDRLRTALQRPPGLGNVLVYEHANHAFFNDTRRDVYDAQAAKDAWQRTLTFLKERTTAKP